MALKQAAVTVTDASGTQDLIVPLGTTVTGLLSMLDIDSTSAVFLRAQWTRS